MDLTHQLALHALVMMFIWVPFAGLQGAFDLVRERRARAGGTDARRWSLAHPLRSAHDGRLAQQH